MKSSTNIRRKLSVDLYYVNPNFCKFCDKIIDVKDNESPSITRKKKFCNNSCSASYNNIGIVRNKINETKLCACGNIKSNKAKSCTSCNKNNKSILEKTLDFYFSNNVKYSSIKLNHIRKLARKILENSDKKKECIICRDKLLTDILQACHIKGIMTYDKATKISEINKIDNLEWMCPNHHILYDRGLINI